MPFHSLLSVVNLPKLESLRQPAKVRWDDVYTCYDVKPKESTHIKEYTIEDLKQEIGAVERKQIQLHKEHAFLQSIRRPWEEDPYFGFNPILHAYETLEYVLKSYLDYREHELSKRRQRRQNNRHNKQKKKKKDGENSTAV